ncbi:MAG: calcium/sodium antiporter [Ilumatobacter sp.]|uniref:calcium/sodium antiporter n=1 Tax=Ilumatobacter sp. TaxID=1967498 RepID=UPI003C72B7B1
MTSAVLTLVGGLLGLVLTGSAIVSGASTIGLRIGLPPLVVGLTIVAAGTSAPELAVVWRAADAGDPGLALGSVVGSNIANVLLVVGLVAAFGAIPIARRTRRIELPVMVAASIGTFVLAADGTIERRDGAILLVGLVAFIASMVLMQRRTGDAAHDEPDPDPDPRPDARDTLRAVGLFAIGVVGVAVAAQFVVTGAEDIALSLGVPQLVVGLTVLAVGTSAPEIVTSVIAAFRGRSDIAVGNAIGSNVFNLLFVLGAVSSTHSDIPVADELIRVDLPVMIGVAALCIPIAFTNAAITRWEGITFVGLYAGYTAYLVLDGLDNSAAPIVGGVTLAAVVPPLAWTVRVLTTRGKPTGRRGVAPRSVERPS